MGGNTFYSNAEAYALEILQQKLIKEAQRSAQQAVMELSALKSFLGQGQLIYCIPFGGSPFPGNPFTFPFCPLSGLMPPESALVPAPDVHHPPALPAPPPPSAQPASSAPPPPITSGTQQSTVHVNVKNGQGKIVSNKPGSDECNLGNDGIDVTIDLRDYLPAEISLDVEEKAVEIKACHVNPQGSKTFARRYDLPACIILDTVRCILSHDGYLMFSAAWCKME